MFRDVPCFSLVVPYEVLLLQLLDLRLCGTYSSHGPGGLSCSGLAPLRLGGPDKAVENAARRCGLFGLQKTG
jgi:hypothetical protein